METLLNDLKFGIRLLLRSPGFAAVAIAALALGIGVNTLMFSVVNGVLLRPLPFPDSARLSVVQGIEEKSGRPMGIAPPDYYTARRQNTTLEGLASFYQRPFNITGGAEAERVQSLIVSSEFFSVLRVNPALGRAFTRSDEQWGSQRVVLLTDGLWKRRYAADPAIIGKAITLNAEPYVVIGVLPSAFTSFAGITTQIYVPMSFAPGDNLNTHNNYFLTLVGRLKPGSSARQALADLQLIARNIEAQFPENKGRTFMVRDLQEAIVEDVKPTLWVLMSAVGFVLLIACANLANLLLARAAGRSREIAVRTALGAQRSRLLRQFVTESLVLSLLGGGFGLLLAYWGIEAVHQLNQRVLPRVQEIQLNPEVFVFTLAVSVIAGVLFGLAPGVHSLRLNLYDVLKEGSRSSGEGASRQLRSALVVSEVALSLMLLVGAGLMLKSMQRLLQVKPGFDPQNVIASFVNLPARKYVDEDLARQFKPEAVSKAVNYFDEAFTRVRTMPGVVAVGAISNLPLTGEAWGKALTLYDRPLPARASELPEMQYRVVAGDYFRVLGIRALAGRVFSGRDNLNSQRVVIVNRELERRFWDGQSAIGKELSINPPASLSPAGTRPPGDTGPEKFTVIGVVDNVHYGALQKSPPPLVYGLMSQAAEGTVGLQLVVRTNGDPLPLVPTIRKQLAEIDPDVPLGNVIPLETLLSSQLLQPRLELILLGAFAVLAMILATIGIYGVMAYTVLQRTREIGIRMALGATPRQVLAIVLRHGMMLVGIGITVGVAGAWALTRAMQQMLFGVSPTDAAVFAAVTGVLAVTALLATYLPARRATRVDPLVALRYE